MLELPPSLLAADLLRLEDELQSMLDNGLARLHFDVMDAHFVPNLSFGPEFCLEIKRRFPQITVDAHLMMDNPLYYLKGFAQAGADLVVLHREVLTDARSAMFCLQALGMRRGLSIKPGTSVDLLMPLLDCLDYILIMTVEPGFGGQKFMPDQLGKIRALRAAGYTGEIAVDGGVNLDNIREIIQAGADVLIMGTSYFHAEDRAAVTRAVKELS